MKILDNGVVRDMTAEEVTAVHTFDYDDAVNMEIRKRYSESQEFAILRQKDEKPEEYAAYYDYCESCKAYVKEKIGSGGA